MTFRGAAGSAAVESVSALLFVMLLVLGVIQVAFVLYGRNIVMASAHEGARAGIELGSDVSRSVEIARRTVEDAAGGVVTDVDVGVTRVHRDGLFVLRVDVNAQLKSFGPIPIAVPVSTSATATRAVLDR